MGYLKSNIKCTLTQIGESKIVLTNPSEIIPLQIVAVTKSIYARRMPTVRLSAGFQHIVNNNLGFRIIAAWENTHKIKIQGKDAITMRLVNEYAKLKDSIIYKIGFLFHSNIINADYGRRPTVFIYLKAAFQCCKVYHKSK